MHNIRPAVALDLARKALIFCIQLVFYGETIFDFVKRINLALAYSSKEFLALHDI